jgi:phosphatidate cytidylyltransferase
MLATRIGTGTILILLTLGVLVGDVYLAPVYPFLLLFQLGLSVGGCRELVQLLGRRAPQIPVCYLGVVILVLANWCLPSPGYFWPVLVGIQAGFLLVVFLYEMAFYREPGRSVERMAVTWWGVGYLGLLPCFFAQLRWLDPDEASNSVRLALAAFVPKCCDIGAYFTGRLLGRTPMTPLLSPKKTWEGAAGGLFAGALTAVAIDRLVPSAWAVLRANLLWEIGFGITVALAGMWGDLAESLIKRDCQTKDASTVVPGFGGILDVVDAIIFSAPVSFLWFYLLRLA